MAYRKGRPIASLPRHRRSFGIEALEARHLLAADASPAVVPPHDDVVADHEPVLAKGPADASDGVEICSAQGQLPLHSVSTPLPEPLKVITLTPDTVDQLRETLRDAEPGTHVVLTSGVYDIPNTRIKDIQGTEENPIVLRAEVRGEAVFRPTQWNAGELAGQLDLTGEHFIIDGLRFEEGFGRQLLISSTPEAGVSHHVTVQHSVFVRSWRHALVAQGHDITLAHNEFYDNLQVNADHSLGVWPYVMGTWWYVPEEGGPSVPNERIVIRGNTAIGNHGEGLHLAYTVGGIVEDNCTADNLYLNIGLNNASDAIVRNNYVTSIEPMLTQFGNAPRGIEMWVEKTGDQPWVATRRITITDNVIDGQNFTINGRSTHGVRVGIEWHDEINSENRAENTYADLLIRNNQISNVVDQTVNIHCIPSNGEPTDNNWIDVPLIAPGVEICAQDRQGWNTIDSGRFLTYRFLRVSEFHYNPPGTDDDTEFIELTNIGLDGDVLDLTGVSLTVGIEDDPETEEREIEETFSIPAGTQLAPGEFLLVVRDLDAFRAAYPSVPATQIVGELTGGLTNWGGRIELDDAQGYGIVDIVYDDVDPWYEEADGAGASLELELANVSEESRTDKYYEWRASTEFGGSPGTSGNGSAGVVINEVLTNSDTQPDAIELFNATENDIDISGWFISNTTRDLRQYQIPAETILPSRGYLVIDESDFGFDLEGNVEEDKVEDVWLVEANASGEVTRIIDAVNFAAAPHDVTLSRIPNGAGRLAVSSRNSLGCENSAWHVRQAVISEIGSDPPNPSLEAFAIDPSIRSDDLEFVEIHNPSASTLDLTAWQLGGGVGYDFADGQTLASGETLLLVPFDPDDPANADKAAAFRAHYGIDAAVRLNGGLKNQLSDTGELIRLIQPGTPIPDDPALVPYIVVDEFVYDDRAPWPLSAGESGRSLQRIAPVFFGDRGTSWLREAPSPGSVSLIGGVSGDFDGDQDVDARDIDILFDVIHAGTTVAYYDLDNSGTVNNSDVDALLSSAGSPYGDANLDGMVNAVDLNRFALNWPRTQCGTWEGGDFNGDRRITAADLNLIGLHWQQSSGAAAAELPRQRIPRAPLANAYEPASSPAIEEWREENGTLLRRESHIANVHDGSESDNRSNDGTMVANKRVDRINRWGTPQTTASVAHSQAAEDVNEELVDNIFAAVDGCEFSRWVSCPGSA